MIKKITVKNFYSIGEEQSFSMDILKKDMLDDSTRSIGKSGYYNTVCCLVGANASGKTSILKTIGFLSWLVNKSYSSSKLEDRIPFELHKLHTSESAEISVEFYEKDIFYRYSIQFNQKLIINERLDKKVTKLTNLFHLTRHNEDVTLKHANSLKINKEDKERIRSRYNISFLSGLIDLGYLPELTFFKNIETNLSKFGHFRRTPNDTSHYLYDDRTLADRILEFSGDIDLGIKELEFLKLNNPSEDIKVLNFIHSSKDKGDFTLSIFQESHGTQTSYAILGQVFPILELGGVLILDEIDEGLHPTLLRKIISLFEKKETNPKSAQLIFSTHQHILLNDRTKTQIFIAEKNEETLETEVYRLDEIDSIRNDENYFQKYLAGTYGGTPNIKWI